MGMDILWVQVWVSPQAPMGLPMQNPRWERSCVCVDWQVSTWVVKEVVVVIASKWCSVLWEGGGCLCCIGAWLVWLVRLLSSSVVDGSKLVVDAKKQTLTYLILAMHVRVQCDVVVVNVGEWVGGEAYHHAGVVVVVACHHIVLDVMGLAIWKCK